MLTEVESNAGFKPTNISTESFMSPFHIFRSMTIPALTAVLAIAGCGGSSSKYTPTGESAKETLTHALTAWQKGEKYGQVSNANPPINVSDFQWEGGKGLESFEILGEEPVPGQSNKMFSVSLKLKGGKSATKTKYVVVGVNPVWVYQEENFKRLLNMDNNPIPSANTKQK